MRLALPLVLLLVLLASPVLAAPATATSTTSPQVSNAWCGLIGEAWNHLASWFGAKGPTVGLSSYLGASVPTGSEEQPRQRPEPLAEKEGPEFDPFGVPATSTLPATEISPVDSPAAGSP